MIIIQFLRFDPRISMQIDIYRYLYQVEISHESLSDTAVVSLNRVMSGFVRIFGRTCTASLNIHGSSSAIYSQPFYLFI